jgi:hypothetical protein
MISNLIYSPLEDRTVLQKVRNIPEDNALPGKVRNVPAVFAEILYRF